MDINCLCPQCMLEIKEGKAYACPNCGHIFSKTQQVKHQLKPFTVLAGKYLVGNVLGEGGFGITYIGFDTVLEIRVAIKEFYPSGFVSREAPDNSFWKQETEALGEGREILDFVDVYGNAYQTEVNPYVKKHDYNPDAFSRNGNRLAYTDDTRYTYRLGIDVSHHQGSIDWEKVKASGYTFAFLRIGYRGYGEEGAVCLDKRFFQNMKAARAAGIDIGVYFFSQAVNEDEAREEAEFVLENLKGFELQLPIVYDPESILDAEARTDNVTGEQFTKNTITFCEVVKSAGYEPMIYSNMLWEAFQYDLEQLAEYPIWYADYELLPQTPYHFEFWQYSNTASIEGIDGVVDLDIQLVPFHPAGRMQ